MEQATRTLSLTKLKIEWGVPLPESNAFAAFLIIPLEGMKERPDGKIGSVLWKNGQPEKKLALMKKFLAKVNGRELDYVYVPFVEGKGIRVHCLTKEENAMFGRTARGPRQKKERAADGVPRANRQEAEGPKEKAAKKKAARKKRRQP